MWLGNLTTEISGAWGEKRKIAEIKITSSEFDASGPVREMGNRKKDACIVRWACIFTLQTWVHSVNRIRQVNCTQQAVKAGNRIHVESQFTPQLGSGGASLWKQGSELQSAFFFPLSLSLCFFPQLYSIVGLLQWDRQDSTTRLWASHPMPAKKCPTSEDAFHILLIA